MPHSSGSWHTPSVADNFSILAPCQLNHFCRPPQCRRQKVTRVVRSTVARNRGNGCQHVRSRQAPASVGALTTTCEVDSIADWPSTTPSRMFVKVRRSGEGSGRWLPHVSLAALQVGRAYHQNP